MDAPQTWPPAYKIRRSRRSRNISAHISPENGLEIIIPWWCSKSHVPIFIEEKRNWIEKHLSTALRRKKARTSLPAEVVLHAITEHWQINYDKADTASVRIIVPKPGQLVLYGNTENVDLCLTTLSNWLNLKGHQHLIPMLERVSSEVELGYKNINIRGQKTLWGSCTKDNVINLNYKLLMLPQEYVYYILVHELAHTVHHNHSRKFWALVENFVPNYLELRKAIRKCDDLLPAWIY